MATRSSISIRNADGTYTGIYCHWDGYLSNNGRILAEHYGDETKIRELMSLGDLSSLGRWIGQQHDFNSPPDNTCTAYGRDRGETGCEARTRATLAELLTQIGQEYDYLWEGNGWHVRWYRTDGEFVTMDEARRLEKEEDEEMPVPAAEEQPPAKRTIVVAESEDFGGLKFVGPGETALELAELLRPVVEQAGAPNYLSDFVFALEVGCQDVGLLDENFNRIG